MHKVLYFLKKKNIDNVIIEASSHGLKQQRLHFINFKGGIFTNFSQDHLDYHKTMNSYLNSKLLLFREILSKKSTVISDRQIKPFTILSQIAKKRKLKILSIEDELEKNKNFFTKFKK